MFEMDKAELDFGIYRIINQKREEITKFLDIDLLPQVQSELSKLQNKEINKLENDLQEHISQLEKLGAEIKSNKKVIELEAKLKDYSIEKTETEIYSDLLNFFKRYYDSGDFMSLRRYKEGVYAIPYEGEEVKLHWANHDQYYIKTTEDLKNYVFKLNLEKKVRFELIDADTEKDNNKSEKDKDRKFSIYEETPISIISENELVINFEFKVNSNKQDDLIKNALNVIFQNIDIPWQKLLNSLAPTEKKKDRTILEKHIKDFVSKNTFDYFIHKDLGKFLSRELDFFIKNEIIHLDDVDSLDELKLESYLNKVKVLRKIAHKIISFLAQIEDFQKKLWLKKKFVIETNYCLTLDKIFSRSDDNKNCSSLILEIVSNKEQLDEWIKLFSIEDLEGFTSPLTDKFLRANDKLVLDTKFFSSEFKYKLLSLFNNLDEECTGLLINSENFQALNLMLEKYREKVQCVYIDPPYNTKVTPIIYKNNFKHSTWLSFLFDRLKLSKHFLLEEGVSTTTIDDYEVLNLWRIKEDIFSGNHLGTVSIRINPKGRMTNKKVSLTHEYAVIYGKSEASTICKLMVAPEDKSHDYKKDEYGSYYLPINLRKQGIDSEATDSNGTLKERFFPIYVNESYTKISTNAEYPIEIFPIDSNGQKRIWRRDKQDVLKMFDKKDLWIKPVKGTPQVYFKFRGGLEGQSPKSIWVDKEFSASEYGTKILDNIIGLREIFPFPKSPKAVKQNLKISSFLNSIILDYFAGSGTTGHAVLELNREDQGNRKFILVEMGKYFNTVLKPRISKAIYSKDWKNGKPESREGISSMFKYSSLESYEDTLNNLDLKASHSQLQLISSNSKLREEYMLSYMLDLESKESLLRIKDFTSPFDYKLKIIEENESKEKSVDLIETFNYLLGFNTETVDYDSEKGILYLEGKNNADEKILIIWRDLAKLDNEALNEWFSKRYSTKELEYAAIYVNGDNNLENLKLSEDRWKLKLIESEFHRLMFDTSAVEAL